MITFDDLLTAHIDLSCESRALLEEKVKNYSGDDDVFTNFRRVDQLGICSVEQGILARIADKFGRLITHVQTQGGLVGNEGFKDGIHDLINYLVFLYCYVDGGSELTDGENNNSST